MATLCEDLKQQKTVFLNTDISPFVFDLFCTIKNIKEFEDVTNVYLNSANSKLEIYVFYKKEDFEIENKILKEITNWEDTYKYFPEIFIYPLDMIEDERLALPKSAEVM